MTQPTKIKGGYPMSISSIVFDDGHVENFSKRTVIICGDFIVAESDVDDNDPRPTMYNLRYIREIRNVEEHKPPARVSSW